MKTLLLIVATTALVACHSSKKESDKPSDRKTDAATTTQPVADCTCGDADTAFYGCAHPLCVSGEGNPDNPDCVCGPLSIDE